jgi:PEP-CTERM motif
MKTRKLLNRVDTRLAACAAVAAATGASMAVKTADATIIYSGVVNIAIPITTAGVYLNVVTGVNDPNPSNVPGWDVNPYGSTSLILFNPSVPAGGVYENLAGNFNLPFGTLVSAAGTFGSGTMTTLNLNSDNNWVGFRFQNEANGNQIEYAWFQIHIGASSIDPARAIIGYAYEDSGGSILVGQVPEPSTFALLGVMAAGALGVREWRKRKAA